MLHTRGIGKPELSPSLMAESSSLADSSRMHVVTVTRQRPCSRLWHQSCPPGPIDSSCQVVGDELEVLEMDGLVLGELDRRTSRCHWWRRWVYVELTIGTSRGKARYKSPFLVNQQSVFFTLARYKVVKIAHSSFELVLQTIRHTVIYPSSSPYLEVIALCPMV
jgi:hypothetical protein